MSEPKARLSEALKQLDLAKEEIDCMRKSKVDWHLDSAIEDIQDIMGEIDD